MMKMLIVGALLAGIAKADNSAVISKEFVNSAMPVKQVHA